MLLKALEKQTEQRWATAEEMATALEAAVPECSKPEFQKQMGDYVHLNCVARVAPSAGSSCASPKSASTASATKARARCSP